MHLDVLDWIFLACGLPFIVWLALPTRRRVQRAGERWAREWSAYVPPDLVPAFDRRTRLDARVFALLVVVLLIVLMSPLADETDMSRFVAVVTFFFLPMLVWRASRGIGALPPVGRTRVARARSTALADYVPPWAFGLLVASAAAPAGVLLIVPHRHGALVFAVTLQAMNCVVAAAALVRVARASLPAADQTELYLRDADRASAMISVLKVPAWTAFVVTQQISFDATSYNDWSVAILLLAFAILVASQALEHATKRRFRSRLWPERLGEGASVPAGQAASS